MGRNVHGRGLKTAGHRLAAWTGMLIVAFVALSATSAQAQISETLVSNMDQTGANHASSIMAQGFTTGSESSGYTLTSVGVSLGSRAFTGNGILVRIFTVDSDGEPDSLEYTLSNPATLTNNAVNMFTAPANATLAAGTTYSVVVTNASSDGQAQYPLERTSSAAEDDGAATGWSIEDTRYWHSTTFGTWNSSSTLLKISVHGYVSTTTTNTAVTGQPTISGTPQVGETLTAAKGTIADDDGLPSGMFPAGYTFQWIRVASDSTETAIMDATASTYTPVAADVGHTVKVAVSFTDNGGVQETLTSDAYPSEDYPAGGQPSPGIAAQKPACPTDSEWCAEMTVGLRLDTTDLYGYQNDNTIGAIDPQAITYYGTTSHVAVLGIRDKDPDDVQFSPTEPLPANTVLKLNGTAFPLTRSIDNHSWPVPMNFGWTVGQKVTVSLNFPPRLTTATVTGRSLVLTYHENLDTNSVPAASAYTVQVDSGSGVHPTDVSVSGKQVTLTLATAVTTSTQTVRVSYTVPSSGPVKDTSGIAAPGFSFTDQMVDNNATEDATLSSLALANPADSSTVPLSPAFDSATTTYTATVQNSVDKLTVTPATTNSNATFAYLDSTDATLTDADTMVTGHQVSLAVGSNTFKVKVTAEDAMATQTYTVTVTRADAEPPDATGQPTISGTPQVNEILTAAKGTIADADGLPSTTFPAGYTFQWIRVASDSTETAITDAVGDTYRPVADDVGHTLKVAVTFIDAGGAHETLTSDTYPAQGYPSPGIAAEKPACPTGHEWCEEMTVGFDGSGTDDFYGYDTSTVSGQIDNPTITYDGTTSHVTELTIRDKPSGTDDVIFGLTVRLPVNTVLKADGTEFPITLSSTNNTWPIPTNFGWVEGQKVTLSLSFPPRLTAATVTGTSLVLTYHETLDTQIPPPSAYSVSVDGGAGVAPTQVGIDGATVTLTLATAVTNTQEVEVSYTVPTDIIPPIGPVQDTSGIAAPGFSFTDQTVTNNTENVTDDATLSSLTLVTADNTTISLSPPFHPGSESYGASVGNSVDELTVTATPTDDDATVAYLDGTSVPLDDADDMAEGHQVSLTVGSNTFEVRVTSEDTNTTKTYLVTVFRAEAPMSTGRVLVGNTGQLATTSSLVVGSLGSSRIWAALAFTTGGNEGGYTLSAIDARLDHVGTQARPRVSLYTTDAAGRPDASLAVLTNPATIRADALNTFTAPAGTTLAPDTDYAVVFENTAPGANFVLDRYSVDSTGESAEDAGSASGWRLADRAHLRSSDTGPWTVSSTFNKPVLAIKGYENETPSSPCAPNGHQVSLSISSEANTQPTIALSRTDHDCRGIVTNYSYWPPTEVTIDVTPRSDDFTVSMDIINGGYTEGVHGQGAPDGWIEGNTLTATMANLGRPHKFAVVLAEKGEVGTVGHTRHYFFVWLDVPKPGLRVSDAVANEADERMDFTVTMQPARRTEVTVDYATEDATATAPDDYTATSETLTFSPGETSKIVAIELIDDTIEDNGERFRLKLSNASGNVPIRDATGVGTILNTDRPAVSVADASATEGASVAFTVSLAEAGTDTATVRYATAGDTATSETDFTAASGTLTFAAGETSKTVSVATIDDTTAEDDETFTLTLSNPRRLQLGEATATGTIEDDDEAALTASFTEVPESHDGSSDFAFRLAFSEPIVTGFRVLRDEAFTVTGGTVTEAKRVDGRSDLWTIRVEPAGTETVTVSLPATTGACSATGAICAAGSLKLSGAASAEIAGPPVTASFSEAPAEHDGSSPFTLTLTFSEEPDGLGFRTVRDGLFTVTGGEIVRVKRTEQGSNLGFRLTVEPSGHGAVTLALATPLPACGQPGAVCTADGRALTGPVTATVQGPPGLSVADAEADEGPNAALAFAVSLGRAASGPVTVDYATSNVTATAGKDYTATSGTLTFAAGETLKTISVPVLDDAHDDDGETLRLTLSNPSGAYLADGEATGTIHNDDPMQQAWLSRFGRTVGTHVTDAVGDRLRGPPGQASHVTIGGYRLPLGRQTPLSPGGREPAPPVLSVRRNAPEVEGSLSKGQGEGAEGAEPAATDGVTTVLTEVARVLGMGPGSAGATNDSPWLNGQGPDPRLGQSRTLDLGQRFTLRDVLLGSSFQLALNGTDTGATGPQLTAWGRFAGTAFDGQDGDLSLDGDVFTGTVGVDGTWDRWLAGVAVAHSRGEGGYTMPVNGGHDQGELENSLTSLHPYLRYAVTDRLDVWGMVGYGWGDLEVEMANGDRLETDTTLVMGSFGGRGILLAPEDTGGFQLATRTDAMLTRTSADAAANTAETDADAHRVRVILEGSRAMTLAEGRTFTPTLEVGLRHDWGDAETGFGLEVGGRVRYADTRLGLTVEGTVRGLLAHEDSHYQEWGASGNVRLAPGANGHGLAVTLRPTWGAAQSGVDGLWSRQTTTGLAPAAQRAQSGQVTAEVGYGLPVGTGLLTPYAGTVLAEGATRTYRVGTRVQLRTGLTLNLEGARQEPAGPQPVNQGVQLQATWGF